MLTESSPGGQPPLRSASSPKTSWCFSSSNVFDKWNQFLVSDLTTAVDNLQNVVLGEKNLGIFDDLALPITHVGGRVLFVLYTVSFDPKSLDK